MANQIKPLTHLATEEVKEINREDHPHLSQAELFRMEGEKRELVLKLEKLNKKLVKKKNELETERANSNTSRQLIQALNTRVQQLENAAPPPSAYQRMQPVLNPVISEEFVERLVIDKTGLESQVYEQKREIEFLSSELISSKKKLTLKTESHNQGFALNQELTQARIDLQLRDQQLEECKVNYLKLETECQLEKQLFQEKLNSLSAEKEQLQQEMNKQLAEKEQLQQQEMNRQIAEKEQLQQEMNNQLAEKEQLQQEMNKQLAEKEQLQQEMNRQLAEKEQLQQEMNKQLAEKEQLQQQEMNRQLAEKDTLCQEMEQQKNMKENEIDQLSLELGDFRKLREQSQVNETETKTVLNGTIRNLEEKIQLLEEKEKQLVKLNATFAIMTQKSNKLAEENEDLKTKQQADEQHIINREISEIQTSASVAMERQFDSLKVENSKLQHTNEKLNEDLKFLETECNARIEELRERQQETIENINKQHLNELQGEDYSINKLANQLETIKAEFKKVKDEILRRRNWKFPISNGNLRELKLN